MQTSAKSYRRSPVALAFVLVGAFLECSPLFAQFVDPVVRNISAPGTLTHAARGVPFDMDGDGDLDVVAAYSLTDAIYLALNADGAGGSWTLVEVASTFVATRAIPFDGNCDGVVDIAGLSFITRDPVTGGGFETRGKISWFRKPAVITTPQWTEEIIDDTIVHAIDFDAADVDGDGDTDLAVVTVSMMFGNSVALYENRCGATSGPRWQKYTVSPSSVFGAGGSVRFARIDADQFPDIVAADRRNGSVSWYPNLGMPRRDNWTRREIVSGIAGPNSSRPYDIDRDGDLDVLVAFQEAGRIDWFEHPADPVTGTWTPHSVSADFPAATDAVLGDFTNDGLFDVAGGSPAVDRGGTDSFAIFVNNGNGTYIRRLGPGNYFGFATADVGDIDRDGDADVVTASRDGDRMDWWENRHPVGTPPPAITSVSPVSGPASGGTTVTISGSNFTTGASVTIGGVAATGVTVVSGTTISAVTPARAAGVVPITVRNASGAEATLQNAFTFIAAAGASGDADGNGSIGVSDVFYLINFLFTNGPAPRGRGDSNGDGAVSVSDVFYLINFLFANGPAPI